MSVRVGALLIGRIDAVKHVVALYLLLSSVTSAISSERQGAPPSDLSPQDRPTPPEQVPQKDLYGDPLPRWALARLGTVRFRFGGYISSLGIPPGGDVIAVAGNKTSVLFYDLATGKVLREFKHEHEPQPHLDAYFSKDGKTLVTHGKEVSLWDVASGKLIRRFDKGTDYRICATALSPDGKTIALAVSVFEGKYAEGHEKLPTQVILRDVGSGKALRRFGHHPQPISEMAFAADGRALGTVSFRRVEQETSALRRWDVETGKLLSEIEDKTMIRVQFCREARLAAVFNNSLGIIEVWDLVIAKQLAFRSPRGNHECFAFSPNGKHLAIKSEGRPIGLWDLATGEQGRRFYTKSFATVRLTFNPEGSILVAADGSGILKRWHVASGEEIGPQSQHDGFIPCVAFSADSKTVATGGWGSLVCLWDAQTGKRRLDFRVAPFSVIRRLQFTPDGRTLIVGDDVEGVTFWNTADAKQTFPLKKPANGWSHPALSPDGKTLAFLVDSDQDPSVRFRPKAIPPLWGDIQLCDISTGKELKRLAGRFPTVFPLVFSRDGRLLACVGSKLYDDNADPKRGEPSPVILVWDLMNGALRRKCQGAVAGSQSIVFSPDRRTIIDTSGTGFVRIWDAETGRIRLQFKGCKNANHMFSAALSTDGKVVATSGPDEFVRLWHAATGEQLGQFEGHCGGVSSVTFSPDGRWLASGSTDTTVLVWDLEGYLRHLRGKEAPK